VQIPTKYKIPTIYYVNIRPNRHSEIPKSKATYSRAANTKTNGENWVIFWFDIETDRGILNQGFPFV
jgi:hypothetical protein